MTGKLPSLRAVTLRAVSSPTADKTLNLCLHKIKETPINWQGIIIGAAAFLIIGIFHPIVIKSEYYFGKKVWPVFLVVGVISVGLTLMIENTAFAAIVGIFGFSCLWSINELIEQEERVRKGWFPANPKRPVEQKKYE